MASWTDKTPRFNPYIQQLPIEEMAKVGMAKQGQYDQGIQAIQTNIDNIAGLDVVRDIDKVYLQSKLNELGNNLKTVAAGDFSNFQLVNSVTGMTKNIAKDKNVLNAVSSTKKYRKELRYIEEQKKKGAVTPDNLYKFQKGANEWLTNQELDASFNTFYINYFDVEKHLRENIDKLKEDGYSFDEIYTKDRNGKLQLTPSMQRKSVEGLFPARIKTVLDQLLSDPRVSQQLQITGEYNYRTEDSDALVSRLAVMKTDELENVQGEIEKALIEQANGKNVTEKLDNLNLQKEKIKNTYSSAYESANNNPDLIRGMLYKTQSKSNYLQMFSYKKELNQTLKNPEWEGRFEMQKESTRNAQWQKTHDLARDKYNLDVLKATIAGSKTDNKTTDGKSLFRDPSEYILDPESSDLNRLALHNNSLQETSETYNNLSTNIVFDVINSNGQLNKYIAAASSSGNDMSKEQKKDFAVQQYFKNNLQKTQGPVILNFDAWKVNFLNSLNKSTTISTDLKEQLVEYNKSYQNLQYVKKIDNDVKFKFDESLRSSGAFIKVKTLNPIQFGDKVFSPEDQLLIGIHRLKYDVDFDVNVDGAKKNASDKAYSILVSKYGENTIDKLDMFLSKRTEADKYHTITPAIDNLRRSFSKGFDIAKEVNYKSLVETQVNVINNAYSKNANVSIPLAIGDGTKDKQTLAYVKNFADSMQDLNTADKDEFEAFKKLLVNTNDLVKLGVVAKVNSLNRNEVTLTIPGKEAKMNITSDMASKVGIDVNRLYKPVNIRMIEDKLSREGATVDDIMDKTNYTPALAAMTTNEFPNLRNNKEFDVYVQFKETSKGIQPFVRVTQNLNNQIVDEMFVNNIGSFPDLITAREKLKTFDPNYLKLLFLQQQSQ